MIKTPLLAVDGIVEVYTHNNDFQGVVLIERGNEPKGLALPGGFVDIGESVEDAVVREMKEELGLDVTVESLLGVYSDPSRDPRGHTVSIVYICKAFSAPKAGDDAKDAAIYPVDKLLTNHLVFDHAIIIQNYLDRNTHKV